MTMARRMKAWCNGISLTDAVPSAIIRGVQEDDPEIDLMTGERPGQPGQRVLYKKRTQLTVSITIVIRELFDLEKRAQALQAVCAWAQDGVLELSNRPDQHLECIVAQRPALGADRDYTQQLTVEFAAIACPYWLSRVEDTTSGTGTSGTLSLTASGSVETPLMFDVTPSGGALESFSVTANGEAISLTGLNVAAGKKLKLYYDQNALQWITADGVSVLSSRSAASADDIWISPGAPVSIAFTASTASAVTVKTRGRWY